MEGWRQEQIEFDRYEKIQNRCRQSQLLVPTHESNGIRYINQLRKE